MKNGILLTVLSASFFSLLVISCGKDKSGSDSNDSGQNSTNNNNTTGDKKYRDDELNSITYSGSLVVSAAMLGSSLKLDSETPKVYEISAPLFPIVTTLYNYEGTNYPTTADGQKALAKDGYTTFEKIRDACLTKDPRGSFSGGIKIEGNSQTLTAEERAENYSKIAQCAYEYFGSKPYSIPQLVSDVDLCAEHLGTDWRLLSEEDIATFTPDVYSNIKVALEKTSGAFSWGSFYFSLAAYTQASDGNLKIGSLFPDAASRVTAASFPAGSKHHLESHGVDGGSSGLTSSTVTVRCIRVLE
jgi:hypothetical protein